MIADRWGVTPTETALRFPCDDVAAAPSLAVWRGVTVRAVPDAVWPWLGQLRVAPYSYDWVDNLGRRSPSTITDASDPAAGDAVHAFAGRRVGVVVSAVRNRQLTLRIGRGVLMSYVLVPGADHTRMLLKIVTTGGGRARAAALSLLDLPMARRQLLTLKRHAERTQRPRLP